MDITPGRDDRPSRDRHARSTARPFARRGLLAPLQQFFATSPVACPYIAGRSERKLIVELTAGGGAGFYDELSRAGFRRSHRYAYRPSCRACLACVPVRIAALDLGTVRMQQKQYPAAVKEFQHAIRLDPNQTDAHYRLGRVYQAMGDKTAAEKEFAKTRELHQKLQKQ